MKLPKLGEWTQDSANPDIFILCLRSCEPRIQRITDSEWMAWANGRGLQRRYPDRRAAERGAIAEVRAMFDADMKLLDKVELRAFKLRADAAKEVRVVSKGEDIWTEIAKLHERDGTPPLNQTVGLWRRKLADGWSIAVNGHAESIKDEETQFEIKPYNAIAVWGGMPYLYFGPPGPDGIALGHGSEDAFWAALQKTLKEQSDA